MRAIALTLLALGAVGPMSAAVTASETEAQEPVHVTIYGGIGLGELIHLDVGWLVKTRVCRQGPRSARTVRRFLITSAD